MVNKLTGVLLASTLALTGCEKSKSEEVDKTIVTTSLKAKEVVDSKYFNNFYQVVKNENGEEEVHKNWKGILFPIGVEETTEETIQTEAKKNTTEDNIRFSPDYSYLLDNQKNLDLINKGKFSGNPKATLEILDGNITGNTSEEYYPASNNSLGKENFSNDLYNKEIGEKRAKELFENFLENNSEVFNITGLEKIEIVGNVKLFSEEEKKFLEEVYKRYFKNNPKISEVSKYKKEIKDENGNSKIVPVKDKNGQEIDIGDIIELIHIVESNDFKDLNIFLSKNLEYYEYYKIKDYFKEDIEKVKEILNSKRDTNLNITYKIHNKEYKVSYISILIWLLILSSIIIGPEILERRKQKKENSN